MRKLINILALVGLLAAMLLVPVSPTMGQASEGVMSLSEDVRYL